MLNSLVTESGARDSLWNQTKWGSEHSDISVSNIKRRMCLQEPYTLAANCTACLIAYQDSIILLRRLTLPSSQSILTMIPDRRNNRTTENPGLVDLAPPRRPAAEVAREKQQKEISAKAARKAQKVAADHVAELERQGKAATQKKKKATSIVGTKVARKRAATSEVEVSSFYFSDEMNNALKPQTPGTGDLFGDTGEHRL